MTLDEVKLLQRGDQVFWRDPDNDICSRYYHILEIHWREDEMVSITDILGDELQCLAQELE